MTLRVAATALRQAFVARSPGGRTVKARWQSTSAHDAAQRLLLSHPEKKCVRRTEVLDGVQLQKLSLTLGRRQLWPGLDVSHAPPPTGTPVPPGYHLAYFTPAFVEADLGPDGTDKSFNPPAPFTRRMWAGGNISWNSGRLLRVGQTVEERTFLQSAVVKRSSKGYDMIMVEVRKEFWPGRARAPAIVDQRNWIFSPEVPTASDDPVLDTVVHGPSTCVDVDTDRICEPLRRWSCLGGQDAGDNQSRIYPERRVRWSPVGLFRFSALTFNGHRIHYDGGWTRRIEGHRAPVVHGPLNLIGMLDYWRDRCKDGGGPVDQPPSRISYRTWAPLYAGDEYSIQALGDWASSQNAKEKIQTAREITRAEEEAAGAAAKRWDVAVQRGDTRCMTGNVYASVPPPPGGLGLPRGLPKQLPGPGIPKVWS